MSKTTFFGDAGSTYTKTLRQVEHEDHLVRLAKAQKALQDLKEEIDSRIYNLREALDFLDTQEYLYNDLKAENEKSPNPLLKIKMASLNSAIERFKKQMEDCQPERVIAELSDRYNILNKDLQESLKPTA
ncbi:hypothetical protein [Legionella jordanis]|uniref:Coiled coil protein n=1 Tax=Legionella jordanis TaxID=456 RepID=A0A0W0V8T6_9GAMM|nr:hypothetical protein [Legionella jordanis]KTD16551.1 hypothetical protein Ljor_0857 [Legionella jordanis]RMX03909.1 hypothetical protein EAW55_06005 [Legionella jordanis]RMX22025.1 hypothetical protein EAS68_00405 [Legionella jordanis]VEH11986.1 Uncharacterised protein [Legionella jordanis]HAT8712709.1 hypothetical protein [Legionella jordanis]